jgi:hypothetical protein
MTNRPRMHNTSSFISRSIGSWTSFGHFLDRVRALADRVGIRPPTPMPRSRPLNCPYRTYMLISKLQAVRREDARACTHIDP